MRITQHLQAINETPMAANAEAIESETMFFNATGAFLDGLGMRSEWPIARAFLRTLEPIIGGESTWAESNWSLDTRSHMLMRGWFPAIPGWHHDDVDRSERSGGQPDYDDVWYNPTRQMYVCVIDAIDAPTGSLTEFIGDGEVVSVPWPVPDEAPVYRYWDAHIEREVEAPRTVLKSGIIYRFDQTSFHRAMPAVSNGWRWFARLTENPGPRPTGPKIRRQSQVYLPTTNLGW